MTAAVRGTRRWRRVAVMPVLALAVAGLAGCATPVDEGPKPSLPGTDTTITTTNGFFGQVVSDAAGRTLYQFDRDRPGESTCYGPCAEVWQPYIATGEPTPAYPNLNPLESSEIDVIARTDGTQQVSYMGKPLYFHRGDTRPADVTGVGKREFGGLWTGVTSLGNPVIP